MADFDASRHEESKLDIVEQLRISASQDDGFTPYSPNASELNSAADEIERLRAERDALLKDAERYRWLQDHQQAMGWFAAYAERASDKSKWKTEMNRQIDAALSREKPNADQL